MPLHNDIVAAARAMVGTPYQHRGFSENAVDCYGLMVHVAKAAGAKQLPRLEYGATFETSFFSDHFHVLFDIKGKRYRREGAVLALRQARFPCHLGILTRKHDQWHMIHANIRGRKVVEEPIGKPFFYHNQIFSAADFYP